MGQSTFFLFFFCGGSVSIVDEIEYNTYKGDKKILTVWDKA